jgi:SAM-dependent methyltransferase
VLDSAAERIRALPDDALVLDVGGWAAPLPRADWVIDLLPYETRGLYGPPVDPATERFTAQTWVQRDICATAPWPFGDDQFDFVVCSHTLEDVRDPVRVCEELVRVAKAGYVEVPAPIEDLTFGIHGPWVGWSHHHWISELEDGGVRFTLKPHLLVAPDRHLPAGSCEGLPAEDLVLQVWWERSFPFREQVLIGAEEFDAWLGGLLETSRRAATPVQGTPPRRPWRPRQR